MTKQNSWFAVDKDGLRKLIDARGKSFAIFELVQNAWDTAAENVSIRVEKLPGRPFAEVIVIDDDPRGFNDLSHAYTLFAESEKKVDPTKRGRFNLGEKLVLALCKRAQVESTDGTVIFNEDGTLTRSRKKTKRGSVFQAIIRMNQAEYDEVCADMMRLIPPESICTIFNSVKLTRPAHVAETKVALPTITANSEGVLTRTKRKTSIHVYEAEANDTGWLYEMGIPVVETGDTYSVDIGQKVPLNMDRDNVTAAYLRQVRAAVLNATADYLTEDVAQESWVTNALEDDSIADEAVEATVVQRFGEKAAIWDPSDREANMTLTGRGYNVVSGGSLPKKAWEAVKRAEALKPAGRVAPTPKPFTTDPDAPDMEEIHPEHWTQGMREVADIIRWLARGVGISDDLLVRYGLPPKRRDYRWAAAWGKNAGFIWNVTVLGENWFDRWHEHPTEMLDTIIHEFAHHKASNHLDEKFHKACTDYGAKVAMILYRGGVPHWRKVGR